MEENIKIIKKACVKANPEIMELKFGCRLEFWDTGQIYTFLGMSQFKTTYTYRFFDDKNKLYNCSQNGLDQFRNNLGRNIRLTDVLLAIKEKRESDFSWHGTEILSWNLLNDSLDAQSPETLEFIAGLLK